MFKYKMIVNNFVMDTYIKIFDTKKIKPKVILLCLFVVTIVLIYSFCLLSCSKLDFFFMFKGENFSSICCVVSNSTIKQNINSDKGLNDKNKYENKSIALSNCENLSFKKIILNGDKAFLYLDTINLNFDFKSCKNILSSSYLEFKTDKLEYIKGILSKFNATCVLKEKLFNNEVEYFSVPFLQKFKIVNGFKVNLQIVWGENDCIVGYPMIYTSY